MNAIPNIIAKRRAGVPMAMDRSQVRGRPRADPPRMRAPHIDREATAAQPIDDAR
jgi:hypothetical protein